MNRQEKIIESEEQAVAYLQRDAAQWHQLKNFSPTVKSLIDTQEAAATQAARARIGLLGLIEARK